MCNRRKHRRDGYLFNAMSFPEKTALRINACLIFDVFYGWPHSRKVTLLIFLLPFGECFALSFWHTNMLRSPWLCLMTLQYKLVHVFRSYIWAIIMKYVRSIASRNTLLTSALPLIAIWRQHCTLWLYLFSIIGIFWSHSHLHVYEIRTIRIHIPKTNWYILSILVGWLECRFWIQRLTVRTPAAVCCFLVQDTLSALLQSTQLRYKYQVVTASWRMFSVMSFSEE